MTSIADLIADYEAKRITLPGLFEALAARGELPDDVVRGEHALLEAMTTDGRLEPSLSRALAAKLRSLHPSASAPAPAPVPADADATRVSVSNSPVAPSGDADMTMVQPASRPPAPTGDSDATMVAPASQHPAPDAPPLTAVTGTQGTASSSSFNRSSWEQVAGAESAEFASVGMLLKGRFLLEREIGRGGMGVVFLARDERKVEARDRDPYVAVKVLNDEFRRHPDSLIALQRESRRAQLLAHDNIVRVYDFDKDRTIVYMTMEYIDGTDLRTLIRERAFNGMPLAQARPLIEGMGWALKRAHAAGIVHSDFKPGNVMVTRNGVPKVFDFGIARAGKHLNEATGEETVFDAGTLGALTPAYASLEMIQGKEPTPSDDIYALGCVTFELLTGKHPFDKQSAEVALKEGRKPPPVPGLTRRQYKTLCDAVAFHTEDRLQTAGAMIEGMRDIGMRERVVPWLGYGAAAVVAIAGGTWGTISYLHQHHITRVIARFAPTDSQRYANENEAMAALGSLGDDDRKRLVLDQGDTIQNYLLARIDTYWNPAQGRYNFPGAQHVFDLRDQLKLYSPKLDARRTEVAQQKNDLLNTLDTELSQRIAAGAIFESQPDNAVATLDRIRAIDPRSALLHNAELELKYDIAIGQSLSASHADVARQQLALATRLFPDSARLKQREAQLAALAAATAPVVAAPGAAVQSIPQARSALAALVAAPSTSVQWQQSVAAAMVPLRNDSSPETRKLVDALGSAIAGIAGQQADTTHLPQDLALVNFGLQYAPQSAPLLAQRDKLATLQAQAQAQLDQEAATAEVASRIESVRRAAAADDTAKALESLTRIRSLQPDNPFLAKEGPQLVAQAYLGQADDQFQHGKYTAAANLLTQGQQALGNRSDLRDAQARYEMAATLLKANGQPLADADYQRLRNQLAAARKADAQGLAALESSLKQQGHLPQGSFAALLDSLKPSATPASPAAAAPVPTTPAPATPGQAPAATAKPTPGNPSKPATETAGATAPTANPAANAAAGNDPCARPELVGKGRTCMDALGSNGRGPALVVVPGIGGGKPYAMSRTEVTVGEFNRYCRATHACSETSPGDHDAASLPISNISLAQAKGYLQWLSSASGYTYRLPSDDEWTNAAHAGSGWKQAQDSNCIPPGGGDDSGSGPISALGREANPWGLVNMSGNVWEWTTSGGGVVARGGSFNSYWSDCTVDNHRSDSGSAQKDVGFRVLRELK
ncbi:bifunctional serine/threonine-protein kinase/formylglycine-generating enzyme family protein [Rhodanobacter hydrolyticus]|uniref:Protein kinase n=1 Tax=Rhodanobacter hydrolyticus TaxID=2250595 RepID=A0ABW8JAP6_9GAMM